MASLENIDLLLGEALEYMMDASREIKEIKNIDQHDSLKRIGRAVAELWEIRKNIYQLDPAIRRDFLIEYNDDKKRYEDLNQIFQKALLMEEKGIVNEAKALYTELYKISHFGFFRLLSEAGLYRTSIKDIEYL